MKNTTREEALELGLKRYFDGKPCFHGHISFKFTCDKSCCVCRLEKIKNKRKDPEFREKENKREMDKRKFNPEYHEKRKKISRDCYKKQREDKSFIALRNQKYMEWRMSEQGKEWIRNYINERNKNDPLFSISYRIRSAIKEIFRKNGFKKNGKTAQILGCSFEEFKQHIEKQFTTGMSWENRGEWHLDHIVPISNAKTKEDIIALNHFTNFRPLWASENFKKSNKDIFLI